MIYDHLKLECENNLQKFQLRIHYCEMLAYWMKIPVDSRYSSAFNIQYP
jgi:hypothetical protein